jgi:hypothetical protein
MTDAQHTSDTHRPGDPAGQPKRLLHRVCIQCNNMFIVATENFDAKQCPNCHKG